MPKLFLFLLLLSGPSWANCQILELPVDTLNHWYSTKRTTEKVLTKKSVLYEARNAEVFSLRKAVKEKDVQIIDLSIANDKCEDRVIDLGISLAKSDAKVAKLRPWATIGKLTVGVTITAGAILLYNELKP